MPRFETSPAVLDHHFPEELVGKWKYRSTVETRFIKFTEQGIYLISDEPLEFSVSDDGQELTWGDEVWSRKYGSGQTLVGVWLKEDVHPIELSLRDDKSTIWYEGNFNTVGVWSIETSGDVSAGNLVYEEKRAHCFVEGNTIIFYTDFSGRYNQTYSINGDELTITSGTNDFVYDKLS